MEIYTITNQEELAPIEIIEFLGKDINKASDEFDNDKSRSIIYYAENLDIDKFTREEKSIFYYFLSNVWSNLIDQTLAPENMPFICHELERQIYYLRLSIKDSGDKNSAFQKAQAYVNLGNSYNHIGRVVEAHKMWNKALDIYPNFGMAICNIGYGILSYARLIDDKTQILYFQKAYNTLISSLNYSDIGDNIKMQIRTLVSNLKNTIGEHDLSLNFTWDNHSIGTTDNEKEYREWCLENKLFLNPLNDITTCKIAAEDNLYLPAIKIKKEEFLNFSYTNLFNQIKQEYVTARYFLFEAMFYQVEHFSDKNNILLDTFDCSIYSYNMEKAKATYRICYSIFDKMSCILKEYFNIDIKPHDINFSQIWYENRKGEEIRAEFRDSQNWAIRALYWISKDLKFKRVEQITDPDAENIARIRNFIEHKSLKIIDYGFGGEIEEIDNNLTLQISREEFEGKTLKLISLVRASIIYLCKALYIEECKKEQEGIFVPLEYPDIKDDSKI